MQTETFLLIATACAIVTAAPIVTLVLYFSARMLTNAIDSEGEDDEAEG